jgi:hypothetical protein
LDRKFTHSYTISEFSKAQKEGCNAVFSSGWRVFSLIVCIVGVLAFMFGLSYVSAWVLKPYISSSLLYLLIFPSAILAVFLFNRFINPSLSKFLRARAKYTFADSVDAELMFSDNEITITENYKTN